MRGRVENNKKFRKRKEIECWKIVLMFMEKIEREKYIYKGIDIYV